MARNGAGTYSKVNTFVAGTTITAADHNENWDDIAAEITNSLALDGQSAMTGQFKAANGSAVAPSVGFSSDTDTGLYRRGANELGFATAGTAAGYFDGAQKFRMLGGADVADALNVQGILSSTSTSHLVLPGGTNAQRPGSPAAAHFRYNSTIASPEFYDGAAWNPLAQVAVAPQGYLTLASGTPVIGSDQIAKSTVYYTPFVGATIPIYTGSVFAMRTFSELSLTLVSQHVANAIYDVFAFDDAGTLRMGTGPAWSNSGAGTGARGTGASSTELTRVNGLWVNAVDIAARNGTLTYSVAANRATYLGSIFVDGTAGQVTCNVSYGQSRKWGVWNSWNRQQLQLIGGDPTANWLNPGSAYGPANNSANNKLTVFSALPEETYLIELVQRIELHAPAGTLVSIENGIGWNSTTAASGHGGRASLGQTGADVSTAHNIVARFAAPPALGINDVQMLERSFSSGGTRTMAGGENGMLAVARWRG